MTVFTLVFAPHKSVLVFSGPPASGDWVVTGTESYYDEVFVLSGNLIVEDGGNLTFRKVTLKMNCTYNGQYNITVKSGGKFYVLEGTVITSANPDKRIGFFSVLLGSTFRMNNSELHECGSVDPGLAPSGFQIGSDDAIVENSLFSRNTDGINIWNDGVVVRNSNITANDHKGIVVYGCSPTIRNNIISLNSVAGIGVAEGSPTIYNNTITSNSPGIELNNAHPLIQDNIIALNHEAGIVGSFNCSPIIQGNNITSNNGPGIILKPQCEGIIQGNILVNNSEGIHLNGNCTPLIQGNIIKSNQVAGVICGDNSLPEVHWNDIYGKQDCGVVNDDPSVNVNATYNYWGDGPSVSSHVLYNPWLTESIFPFAEITSPLLGELVSSSVTVSTEVDAPNDVLKVEFYIDNQLEYTDYDSPYEWNWDTAQYTEAEHKITAKAHDKFGLKVSTSVTVFVDNTAPTVSIREPAPENTYCGIVRVSVNATDNKEIGNVHVKVDNTEWLVMTYDPPDFLWKYDLNTTPFSDGEHTLMVLALDKASNPATTSTTLLTDNTPPTLTIQTPQSGITVGLTLIVNVQASDSAGISRIEFYIQDVLVYTVYEMPYHWSWDTTKYPNGEYDITIKAYDTVGNTQTSETTVTVKNVESPWWQTNLWTIIQVLVAIGGLIIGILAYLTRKKEEKKKKRKK